MRLGTPRTSFTTVQSLWPALVSTVTVYNKCSEYATLYQQILSAMQAQVG